MPLSLLAMNAAIVCDGKELETYDVKQEGISSLTGFIASEAGKQFKITLSNNLPNFGLTIIVFIDGRRVQSKYVSAGSSRDCLGIYKRCSALPFKFQELQLVDPDLEDAPVAPEMGTIELKAYRNRELRGNTKRLRTSSKLREDPHSGRISERSKKAGWHHVTTGDEIPIKRGRSVNLDYLDKKGNAYVSIKIFYRPRELLRAQGIIPLNDTGMSGFPIKNKKRAREDGSPGPSNSRPKITVKSEGLSGDMATQRIQALQAELDALKASVQSGTFIKREVKCELRSPSPIVVKHSGEVVDLTIDD